MNKLFLLEVIVILLAYAEIIENKIFRNFICSNKYFILSIIYRGYPHYLPLYYGYEMDRDVALNLFSRTSKENKLYGSVKNNVKKGSQNYTVFSIVRFKEAFEAPSACDLGNKYQFTLFASIHILIINIYIKIHVLIAVIDTFYIKSKYILEPTSAEFTAIYKSELRDNHIKQYKKYLVLAE